jgi:predicted transcriptional regulator
LGSALEQRSTHGHFVRPVLVRDLADTLCEDVRIELLLSIYRRRGSLGELAARHALEISVVCKHLRKMLRIGLVCSVSRGRERVYGPGPSAAVVRSKHCTTVVLLASDGSTVTLSLTASQLSNYTRYSVSRPTPTSQSALERRC